ncbi:GroES-like protein [Stereum hirsutum FP-91666 SS1]|uniref:GroES-like protein n=1 Tax=Stereum hirsutum (strain FP-91666) TaxID=721885 RepID=UPI0004449F8E|nr:GroES-like protein [Stereum hirsutum FP-91666 SS1]EIM83882.1 GroES-like protein [Stereum hirsutum FP-91666 SS1]
MQKAVVVDGQGSISFRDAAVPIPSPTEVLIKVECAGQITCDWKTVLYAKRKGAIAGSDFAGTVLTIGSDVRPGVRSVGERVAGFVYGGMTPNGAYSEYIVADARVLIHIPDSWSFENACQLGHSLFNAAQCLYVAHNIPSPSNQTSWAIPSTNSVPSKTSMHTPSGTKQNSKESSSPTLSRPISTSPSPSKAFASMSLPPIHVFDYTSPRVGNEIHIQTKNRLSRVVDCVAERETPMQVACALSRAGGKVASVRYYDSLRDGMNLEFMCAFRLLPYDFNYPILHKANELDIERGRYLARLLTEVVAAGHITPLPVLLMPDGLASVKQGFEWMMEGKTVGQRITYKISDTPGLR